MNNKNENKHLVYHHNMFGPSCEIASLNNEEDFKIYCYLEHRVCIPKKCDNCKYYAHNEMEKGRCCLWEETYDSVAGEEYAVQYRDAYHEFERVDKLIKEEEDIDYPLPGVSVSFAMSKEQANKLNKPVCIQPDLPKSKDVYFAMRKVPDELCEEKVIGWERIIKFKRQNVYKVMEYLYPEGCDFDINKYLTQIDGDFVWIIGFGD